MANMAQRFDNIKNPKVKIELVTPRQHLCDLKVTYKFLFCDIAQRPALRLRQRNLHANGLRQRAMLSPLHIHGEDR
jgi:hypothetical protein